MPVATRAGSTGILMASAHIPYCGIPPVPPEIWTRWNLDPVLLTILGGVAVAYLLLIRHHQDVASSRIAFLVGSALATLALVSPICALSVSLFSDRIGQHMLLTMLAAPLLAVGLRPFVQRARGSSCIAAAGTFAALMWFWHAPAPYAATFASTAVYWAMHVTLIGCAVWLWFTLLNGANRPASVMIGAIISTGQMGLLGALLVFAPRPLYGPHLFTTAAWGLTPLQDQQVGGLLMWVPGCIVFLSVALTTFTATLRSHTSAA